MSLPRLTGLFDLPKLQLLLDSFYGATGVSVAIVNVAGSILVSSTRPPLCTLFYDAHPESSSSCRLSRAFIQGELFEGQPVSTVCPHGLLDAAEPIVIRGERIGALLIGQVFAEQPDTEFYRLEAERYGFDPDTFLDNLKAVPVIGRERFDCLLNLLSSLTMMLVDQGVTSIVAQENERIARQHAERSILDIRRQKAQLRIYAMDHPACSDLLDRALDEALKLTDSPIGYIYNYDEESRLFTLYAWSPEVMSQCAVIKKQTVYELDRTGLWGEAVRQRKPVVTNDYAADNPLKKGVPEGHVALKRHMNLPVFRNGKVVAVVGVGNKDTDYTAQDVNQLQLFMDAVWNVVERRKAEDELLSAKETAEVSSRMKSELMANLSHELRTPLNGVIGGLQLLRFTDLTEEQDEFLSMAEEASANELTLVNNLLELVRMESEGIQVEHTPFSVRQCLDEAVHVHQSAAGQKGLAIHQEVPADLPAELVGDKVRIRQILHSLIGNAIKFTEQGDVTVTLSCKEQHDGEVLVRFSVVDTGIGIAPEKLDRIFELFVQSDMSNTRRFGGLGLGLSICSRLAAAMGGSIRAESEPGSGSAFHLELPLGRVSVVPADGYLERELLVLLVEDDYLSSLTSERMLRKLGHQVVTAFDGREAVEKCRRQAFDLILMDIQMPSMNGFDALRQIRLQERELGRSRSTVIAQTAYARWNYHESFLGEGFDGFIAKPLIREELVQLIARSCSI